MDARRVTRLRRRRVALPATLVAELFPQWPSPVPQEVYDDGPTARAMRAAQLPEFVVAQAVGQAEERHGARPGADQTLCGLWVLERFPLASLLIVECKGCVEHLPLLGEHA